MNKPRLIDANELIKAFNEHCGRQRYLISENVWDMVENAPTAYNMDKVVEQLEECEATCNGRNRSDEYKGCDYESGCAGCVDCKTEGAYRKAIEIVKGGAE